MRLLAVDVGAGTQDILLLNTSSTVENSIKMVMPSATQMVAAKIAEASAKSQTILFTGINMGGGPSTHALKKHLRQGLKAYSTPEAACTFDDDPDEVRKMGVELVSADEAKKMGNVAVIELKDIDMAAIGKALEAFGVSPRVDGIAVAAQDHGAAPKGFSDRVFRFQHLKKKIEARNELITFACLRGEIPDYLTRLKAIESSLDNDVPVLVMDTGPAAALGSLMDERVAVQDHLVIANMGNFHTLAFHVFKKEVLGLFEHHTEMLTFSRADDFIARLAAGELKEGEIYGDGGHGNFTLRRRSNHPFLAVCGPRRNMMKGSSLGPYLVSPYGDMMLTGCFGLVGAFARRMEDRREEIERCLSGEDPETEKYHTH
ncbi:MAG: DUF1786 family protein [Dehalococcoidia bacterium]|nr:DUF1786 family protein [Dehalococcoidia bacterium]MDZ4246076.1 DUF1786 family protein [Dehalococcoidia bacterium]